MDESGGRGQPQSGNDESAERHAGPPARATDPTPADEQPTDERRFTPEQHDDGPATGTPTARPAAPGAAPKDDSSPGDDPADASSDHGSTGGAADEHDPHDKADAQAGRDGQAGRAGQAGRDAQAGPVDRADADADGPRPTAGAEHDGSRAPTGDAHPDRAYAGDPHTAPVADRPEAHPGHTTPASPSSAPDHGSEPPASSTGTPGRIPEPPASGTGAPGTGAPGRHPEPPAPGTGHRHLAHSADGKGPAPQRPEPRGGLLMGRPFGVPVYVAPSWFLVAALITWVFGGQLERVLPELGAARYLVSLFFAVAFYASVLVHELAHTVAALRFKLPVRRIQLQFFGGVSEIEKEAETPGREFVLAFVGPLLSLVLAGVFYGAMYIVEPGTVPGVLLAGLMISNLIVAAFNLLPGLPLDGGRMLRAVVWKLTGKPMTGTIAAAWVGRALAVSVLIGLPLLTQSGALGTDAVDNVGMDTVLDALLAAILAAIIWTGAGNSLRMARLREHLPELRARALTRRAVPVETDTPLSEALRRANAAGARALVVVDADGHPLSLVREAAIVGVPEHRRPWVAVSGLAQELTEGMRVSAELSGEELLDALRATPATEYLVVEETGEIYGVLSAADVERAFVKAMARPS
ncbi:site-2 protease family protein [Streptomyces sp. NPDC006372]|uniref:site-2 protease family protein n=1 Tax=Streptomyces sp. NPDC006372 TaxID=3155599 RepID=UPI0033B3EA5B